MKRTALKTNPCRLCGSKWHTAMACPAKPRKQLKRSRLKKMGKKSKQWQKDRSAFLKQDSNNACIVGGAVLPDDQVTVDHDIARGRGGKGNWDNLNKMCAFHNSDKGSRTIKEYMPIGRKKPCIVDYRYA